MMSIPSHKSVAAAHARVLQQSGRPSTFPDPDLANLVTVADSSEFSEDITQLTAEQLESRNSLNNISSTTHVNKAAKPSGRRPNATAWKEDEDDKLVEGVKAGKSWEDIVASLSDRGYTSCVSRFWRIARDDPERVKGFSVPQAGATTVRSQWDSKMLTRDAGSGDVHEPLGEAEAGSEGEDRPKGKGKGKGKAVESNEKCNGDEDGPSNDRGASARHHEQSDESEAQATIDATSLVLSEAQSRMCTFTPTKYRTSSGGTVFNLLLTANGDGSDFPNLAATLKDFQRCCDVKKTLKKDLSLPPIRVLVAISLNDWSSAIPGRTGKLRWDWGHSRREMVYYNHTGWQVHERQQYQQLGRASRLNLTSVITEWLWRDGDDLVLPILVLPAELCVGESESEEYAVSFSVSNSCIQTGGAGPLLMICLPDHVVFATAQDLQMCIGSSRTGGTCKSSKQGQNSRIRWIFAPSSSAFRLWAADKALEIESSGQLSEQVLSRLAEFHRAAADAREDSVELQKWSEVRLRFNEGC